eukprot:2616802-Rhodomonas_salina.1
MPVHYASTLCQYTMPVHYASNTHRVAPYPISVPGLCEHKQRLRQYRREGGREEGREGRT